MLVEKELWGNQGRMWRRIVVPSNWKSSHLFSRLITTGRATPLGTKYFLEQGNVSMIHSFKNSQLNIHPLILNSPMHPASNKEGLDSLYLGSVLKYRINCFHVYSRSTSPSGTNIWYTTAVEELVQTGIDREGLVTIANLGKISHRDELIQVLEEAWSVTDQEYIDIVTLEVPSLLLLPPSLPLFMTPRSIIKTGKKVAMVTTLLSLAS
jgi:hypothetical protein